MKTYKLESTLYNPQEKSKHDLICDFVIRNNEFNTIFNEISDADMALPKQHYLIIGQRGMGKTTLMMRLKYAIEDDKRLVNTLPIVLKEEHYAIHQLSDLWVQVAEQLEDYHDFKGVLEALQEVPYHEEEYAYDTYQVLEQKLQDKGKQLVLFVDNFNDLLEKFGKQEVYVWRDILMNKPYIRLVASNPILAADITDYQKPLYEFFKQLQLKSLKQKEVITLLRTLAERHHAQKRIENIITQSPERINTLRILSGGVPRTIAMLFNIFVEEQTQSTIQDLYKLLDEVTPLYKHRMDDLKPNQQKIVYEVAMHWDGISVKELAEKAKMPSKIVSAQLNLLSKNQIIEKVSTDTKNNFYRLQERFLNIWYLMRLGNKRQYDRVVWLVRFLDAWCNEDEMQHRVDLYLKDQEIAQNIKELLNEVYLKSEKVPIEEKQKILAKYGKDISFDEQIKYMATDQFDYKKIKKDFKDNVGIFLTKYLSLKNNNRYDILEKILETIGERKITAFITQNPNSFIIDIFLSTFIYLGRYKTLTELNSVFFKDSKPLLRLVITFLSKYSEFKNVKYFLLCDLLKDVKTPIPTIQYFSKKLNLSEKVYLFSSEFSLSRVKIIFNNRLLPEIYKEINQEGLSEKFQAVLSTEIEELLSEEKYFIANQFIENMELKDIMKPYYYVTQYFLDNTQEIKRMGPELQEAFDEIVANVLEIKKIKKDPKPHVTSDTAKIYFLRSMMKQQLS